MAFNFIGPTARAPPPPFEGRGAPIRSTLELFGPRPRLDHVREPCSGRTQPLPRFPPARPALRPRPLTPLPPRAVRQRLESGSAPDRRVAGWAPVHQCCAVGWVPTGGTAGDVRLEGLTLRRNALEELGFPICVHGAPCARDRRSCARSALRRSRPPWNPDGQDPLVESAQQCASPRCHGGPSRPLTTGAAQVR